MLRFPLVRNSRWWCQTSSSYISSLMVNIKLIKLKPTVRKKNLSRPTVNNLSQARAPFFHETKSTYRADFLTHFLTTFHFIHLRSFLNNRTVTTNKSRTGATVNSGATQYQSSLQRLAVYHSVLPPSLNKKVPSDNYFWSWATRRLIEASLRSVVAWIIPSLAEI